MKNNETLAKWMKTRTYKKKPMAQRRGYKPMTHFMVQYKIHGKPLGELLRINIKISVDKIKKPLVEFSLMNNQAFKRYHDDLIDAFKFMMQTVKNKEYINYKMGGFEWNLSLLRYRNKSILLEQGFVI